MLSEIGKYTVNYDKISINLLYNLEYQKEHSQYFRDPHSD